MWFFSECFLNWISFLLHSRNCWQIFCISCLYFYLFSLIPLISGLLWLSHSIRVFSPWCEIIFWKVLLGYFCQFMGTANSHQNCISVDWAQLLLERPKSWLVAIFCYLPNMLSNKSLWFILRHFLFWDLQMIYLFPLIVFT